MLKSIQLVLALACITFNCYSQHLLEYNLKVGDTFRVNQSAIQNMKMTVDGADHNITNTLEGTFFLEVVAKDSDHYLLKSYFEMFKFKTESDIYGIVNYIDTETPLEEQDKESKIFEGLLHVGFQIKLMKTGAIDSVTGSEAIIENMIRLSGIEDEFSVNLIRQGVQSQFSNASLAESLEQMTYMLPAENVSMDATWENSFSGTIQASNHWKLKSYSNSNYHIVGTAIISFNSQEEDVEIGLVGTQETQATIDSSNGFFTEIIVTQYASGTTKMNVLSKVEIPTSLQATITYKRLL